MTGPIEVSRLDRIVAEIFDGMTHAYVDPEDASDIGRAVRRTLRYLKKHGMVRIRTRKIYPVAAAILGTPPLTTEFRRRNPIKFLTNQILHLGDVTNLIERRVLEARDDPPAKVPRTAEA
jgi:hypothetical protein